jgi:pimeloyl-ACP methyl ester carboxylesterase
MQEDAAISRRITIHVKFAPLPLWKDPMPNAQVRGVNIHYQVIGSAGPWVALITGGRRGHQELLPIANKLAAKGYRVVLHDRRNTGASDVVIDGMDGEEEIWTDDLAVLLKQLGALPAFVGGTSSGARTSMLFYLRHPEAVRGLLLMRVTGGAFAAGRLPDNYYGQFIKAAREGGMAAVCATEQYQERITANPANRDRLMAMDPAKYIEVMQRWLAKFNAGLHTPVMGVTNEQLASIKVPTIVIPGNDKTHSSKSALAAHAGIPGARLHQLPITDQDVPLINLPEWAHLEDEIVQTLSGFMTEHAGR